MKWPRMLANLRPWPPRHERKAAIRAAAAEHARSRDAAAESRKIKHQIDRLVTANHFAEIIARDLRRGGPEGGR